MGGGWDTENESLNKWEMKQTCSCRVIKQGSGDSRPMGVRHGDTVANHTDLLYLLSGCGRPPSHYSMVKRLNIIGKIARAKPAYLCTLMMVCRVSRVSCEPVYLHPFCVVMMSLNGWLPSWCSQCVWRLMDFKYAYHGGGHCTAPATPLPMDNCQS